MEESPRASPRRRWLQMLAGFLAVIVVAEGAIRTAYPELLRHDDWPLSDYPAKIDQMEALDRVDVLFVGSSVVMRGVDPSTLVSSAGRPELVGYNAGVRGAYPLDFITWTNDIVLEELEAAVVVVGLMHFGMQSAGCNVCLDRYRSYRTRTGQGSFIDQLPLKDLFLVKYGGDLLSPQATHGRWSDLVDQHVGDNITSTGWAPLPTDEFTGFRVADPTVAPGAAELLSGFVDALDEAGHVVVMVSVPTLVSRNEAQRDDFEQLEQVWGGIAADADVTYLQPPDDLFAPELYFDPTHLNEEGARRFSAWLGRALAEADALPR